MTIFGDGIHDDTAGIQALLDTRDRIVALPMPQETYMISKPLIIHKSQELKLPLLGRIKLMDNSNCVMLKNASDEQGNSDICITGGIWDQNNQGQLSNSLSFAHPQAKENGILFSNVKNLHITHLQLTNPVTFALTLDAVSCFSAEDITFAFHKHNPLAVNNGGIRLNGGCLLGTIRNLKGTCCGDMVTLNADEGTGGTISNIDIDGIFTENSHSAVRLCSGACNAENIHVHNVFGTYNQCCIGIMPSNARTACAYCDGLVWDNIFASKAEHLSIDHKDDTYPLLYIAPHLRIKNLSVANVCRTEKTTAAPTLLIGQNSVVESLSLQNIACDNQTGSPMPLIENNGLIKRLFYSNLRADGDALLAGDGHPSGTLNACHDARQRQADEKVRSAVSA